MNTYRLDSTPHITAGPAEMILLGEMPAGTPELDEDRNTRIETRVIHDQYIDGERCHTMATIWFDGKPFGISQTAGRSGRDFEGRYITDLDTYKEAVDYLLSLYRFEEYEEPGVLDPTEPCRGLNHFYGRFISEFGDVG